MPEFYICDQAEVRSKLKTLSRLSISEDGWTHFYKDEKTDQKWLLTSYRSAQNSVGILLLEKLPRLATDAVIHTALTSHDNNDIAGAILDLLIREKTNQEDFRSKLLQGLKELITPELSTFNKERIKLIIEQCELLDVRNRREIIGKHFSEIEKDASYFRGIAAEAKQILSILN